MASPEIINAYLNGENWDNCNTLFILLATFAEEKMKADNKKSFKKKKKTKKVSNEFDNGEGLYTSPGGMSPDKSVISSQGRISPDKSYDRSFN